MDDKKIFIYCEDIPVHRDVVAHGLHRAAPPLLKSIQNHIDGIAIYPLRKWFPPEDFDQQLLPICTTLPRAFTFICKILQRFAPTRKIADALSTRLLASKIKRSKAEILLCLAGADAKTLLRSERIASIAQKKSAFYLVDDFLSPLRLTGVNDTEVSNMFEKTKFVLNKASHVLTITEGLGNLFYKNYGVTSTTLNLAFETDIKPVVPATNQIIYVGSINYLYADGILDLFRVVEKIRSSSGVDITIRLTVTPKDATRELGVIPSFVTASPMATAAGLAREIASSLFAFLPSSFQAPQKTMVSTSFPSKTIEYLAYARSIVVYGPSYAVSIKRFQKAGLPSTTSSEKDLEKLIYRHLDDPPEYSEIYSRYLASNHSPEASRKSLCEVFHLKNSDILAPENK